MPTDNSADNSEDGAPGSLRRFITRRKVLSLVPVSYGSIWHWMQAGKFPRGRDIGGKTVWFEDEVEEWINSRPVRTLKGDPTPTPPNNITRNRKKQAA